MSIIPIQQQQKKRTERLRLNSFAELMEKISGQQYTAPQSIEMEKSILGSMLIERSCIPEVIEILGSRSNVFYYESHGNIYEAILALYEESEPVDFLTVAQKLKTLSLLDGSGGSTYLVELGQSIVTTAHVRNHARTILEKYIARELITLCEYTKLSAFTEEHETISLLENASQQIFHLSDQRNTKNAEPMAAVISRVKEEQKEIREGVRDFTGVPCGLTEVDNLTHGWKKQNLIIIAARPSQGKSAFALKCAKEAALVNTPVAFFSLEMSSDELAHRLISSQGEFNLTEYQKGKIDQSIVSKAEQTVAGYPIFIRDSPSLTPLELRAESRKLKARYGIGLIIVDYLQLMDAGRVLDSREREISYISRQLKALAKELDTPVIALSQLNRKVEDRATKAPTLSDLRESGAIEQDADKVVFLWRPKMYGSHETPLGRPSENMTCFEIAKHRNGAIGSVEAHFFPASQTFKNYL